MTAILAAARRLSSFGLAIHWLRAPPRTPCPWPASTCLASGKIGSCTCPGKAPYAKEWSVAPYLPPDQVAAGYRPGANLGVHCGLVAGAPCPVVVVDLDSEPALLWGRAHLPPTPWRTLTGRIVAGGEPGEHWYYRHPGGKLPNKARITTPQGVKLALDLRGDGGQVVVAPSIHPSGRAYQEAEPWQPCELPLFDPAWIASAPRPAPQRRTNLRQSDGDLLRKRAEAYLRGMPAAISGQGGHDATLWAAAALTRGFCLDASTALSLLAAEFNPRCDPPWDDRDLQRKVDESLKLSRLPHDGWLRDAQSPRYQPHAAAPPAPSWWTVPDEVREADPDCPPARPEIRLGPRLDEVRDLAIAALASADVPVYVRAGALVDLVDTPPRLRPVPLHQLRAILAGAAEWMRWEGDRGWVTVAPPLDLARSVLDAQHWPGVRELRGIAEAPCLRPDGTVLAQPGYDPSTCLYLSAPLPYPEVPAAPTLTQVRQALTDLCEVVCDFPFAHEAGTSAWLAALLSLVGRPAILGPVPLFIVDGNCPGVGKGLLADAAHMIAYGRELPRSSQGKDAEEDAKALLALAMQGASSVLWDNITRAFGSPALDAALTAGVMRGRVLGKSEVLAVAITAVQFLTGNNVRVRGDFARRSLRISLLAQDEHPEHRQGFRHPRLLSWVQAERPRLLGAALTLLRAYCQAGRPGAPPALGSFEAWSDLVRGCILWCDLPDPMACNDEEHEEADEEASLLPDLLDGWAELCASIPREPGEPDWCGTAEAIQRLTTRTDSRFTWPLPRLRQALAALCGPDLPDQRRLGWLLRKHKNRPVGGRCITTYRTNASKGWRVKSR